MNTEAVYDRREDDSKGSLPMKEIRTRSQMTISMKCDVVVNDNGDNNYYEEIDSIDRMPDHSQLKEYSNSSLISNECSNDLSEEMKSSEDIGTSREMFREVHKGARDSFKWEELTQVGAAAAQEMLRSALNKSVLAVQKSISQIKNGNKRHSDFGSVGGYSDAMNSENSELFQEIFDATLGSLSNFQDSNSEKAPKGGLISSDLPPFSSLSWMDRQLVNEWRTLSPRLHNSCSMVLKTDDKKSYTLNHSATTKCSISDYSNGASTQCSSREINFVASNRSEGDVKDSSKFFTDDFEADLDDEFNLARTRVPKPIDPPVFQNSSECFKCGISFLKSSSGMVRRHHCRLCSQSFCRRHAAYTHKLPHIGYDPNVPERVCEACKDALEKRDFKERILWRISRCRDFFNGNLIPYFEPGVDTAEDVAWRIAQGAIAAAKRIPLGAQAYVAVETVDNLRKHGLKGIYALVLRKEFMAAADLLRRVTGIEKNFPLSVHDLTAAIFYALAQHKAVRGNDPEREHLIHSFRSRDIKKKDSFENSSYKTENDDERFWVGEEGLTSTHDHCSVDSSCSTLDDSLDSCSTLDDSLDLVNKQTQPLDSVIDDTDAFDPLSKSVANLLLLADEAIQANAFQRNYTDEIFTVSNSENQCTKNPKEEVNKQSGDGSSIKNVRPMSVNAVCEPVDNSTVSSLLFYAPLALYFVYAENEIDMQLLGMQQNWQLLYANLEKETVVTDRPASALYLHKDQKIACFAIRGTASTNDVVTDIRAMPVPFPDESASSGDLESLSFEDDWMPIIEGQGLALCGMARAASHLFRENIAILTYLAKVGYRIRITGHSLGGGVAALLGALIRQNFEKRAKLENSLTTRKDGDEKRESSLFDESDLLRVYSYGTPSCVDERLAKHLDSFVVSTVLHDDVVPRLTPTSIRRLVKHLLFIKETWVKVHLNDDINAIADRASRAWAPRFRVSSATNEIHNDKDVSSNSSLKSNQNEHSEDKTHNDNAKTCEPDGVSMIDGELFFEAEETLIESDDESDGMFYIGDEEWNRQGIINRKVPLSVRKQEPVPFDEPPMPNDPESEAVIIEELPLSRMFIPGKIAHIYTHRGAYKIAFVPRDFKELRRISLAGNMLTDHMGQSYYEALMEVRSVRRAKVELPRWAGFAEQNVCSCCASRFTWASTSNSLAQEIRDKHNCRACGKLVCGPCSQSRSSLPEMGLEFSQLRICDKCYYNGMGKSPLPDDAMARSFVKE